MAPRQWGRTRPGSSPASAPAPASERSDRGRGVRLLTISAELTEAVEAVCIGAGVPLVVGDSGARAASSDVVLVDASWPGEAVPPGAVVVALAEHGDAWDVAARHRASAVVVLPQAAAWLAELISRSVDAEVPRALGRVYGVVGATGGIGASTVASWLAGYFAAQGRETALVDGDPLGVGLDLVLGEEGTDGLRWPELNQFSGAVAADQLWAAMPRVETLRYLSWDRRATHAETVPAAAVVAALRGAAAVQVVDLSRGDLERQARWCDAVLVLTPRTVRGVLAAEHAVARCGAVPVLTALTGINVADLEPRVLADATGVPCAATIAFDARVPQHLDDGTVLRRGRTAKHAKTVAVLARALEELS
ncbi:septum site-determining protein Ssd [Kocuria sp. KSNUG]